MMALLYFCFITNYRNFHYSKKIPIITNQHMINILGESESFIKIIFSLIPVVRIFFHRLWKLSDGWWVSSNLHIVQIGKTICKNGPPLMWTLFRFLLIHPFPTFDIPMGADGQIWTYMCRFKTHPSTEIWTLFAFANPYKVHVLNVPLLLHL